MIGCAVKQCKSCDQSLPISAYHSEARASDGLQTYCKACKRTKHRLWRQRNAVSHYARRRATTYGISTREVDAFLAVPNCQACGSTFASDHSVKLDHCHCNGHVRGAICHRCNIAISGSADDAIRRLDCCRQYLIRDLERQNEQG